MAKESKAKKKQERIALQIPVEMYKRLTALATEKAEGNTSVIVRLAIKEYLEKEEK